MTRKACGCQHRTRRREGQRPRRRRTTKTRPGLRIDTIARMRKSAAAAGAIAVVAAAWFAWHDGWAAGRRPLHAPSVLLISVDTLRADRVGAYGYKGAQTPAIDALAARGLRFEQAATVTPLTLPAHTSLMTGTFPAFHGVRDNASFYVGDELVTLAEVLRARGYRTGGFVGAYVLDHRWGIAQGFDRYFDNFDLSRFEMAAGLDAAQRPGSEVVDQALPWLAENHDRPFFAWVHLYDPHSPYVPPEPYRSRFPATMQGAYDGEVATADGQIGRLIGTSRTQRRLRPHRGRRRRRPRRVAGRTRRAAARVLRVRSGDAYPAGRRGTGRSRSHGGRPGAHRRRDAHDSGSRRRSRRRRRSRGVSLMPLGRGDKRDLLAFGETWYPRYHYGWSELTAVRDGRLQIHRRAQARTVRHRRPIQARPRICRRANPRIADALERALREMAARTAWPRWRRRRVR